MKIGLGTFLSLLIIAIIIYVMYEGLGMIWRHIDDSFLKYFLSSIIIFMLLSAVFPVVSAWKSFFSDAKTFSKSYKSEAFIADIITQRFSRRGDYVNFDLVLEIKRKDGSSYKTKVFFQTPVRNTDCFKIGKMIVVDVSADNPDKVRVSGDTYK